MGGTTENQEVQPGTTSSSIGVSQNQVTEQSKKEINTTDTNNSGKTPEEQDKKDDNRSQPNNNDHSSVVGAPVQDVIATLVGVIVAFFTWLAGKLIEGAKILFKYLLKKWVEKAKRNAAKKNGPSQEERLADIMEERVKQSGTELNQDQNPTHKVNNSGVPSTSATDLESQVQQNNNTRIHEMTGRITRSNSLPSNNSGTTTERTRARSKSLSQNR